MSKLTGTHSEVSEIDFTTLTTVPGTVKVHGAPIQILDLRKLHGYSSRLVYDHGQPALLREQMTVVAEVVKASKLGSFDLLILTCLFILRKQS